MRLPTRVDRFVEHALLGDLARGRLALLRFLLALNALTGFIVSWLHPDLASLALLFPCVVLEFFGSRPALVLAWIVLYGLLQPDPLRLATFTVAVLVGSLFARITAERYRQSRTRELELEKAVELARRRQSQLEPPALQVLLGRLEVAASMQVCRQLGGDFLCVETLDEHRVSVVLGDVMGKGLPSGLVAVYLEGVCRQLADQGLEPAALLTGLNRGLAGFDPSEPLFATAVCVEADFLQGCWKVARAGHELPVMGGRPVEGEAHLPLGLDPGLEVTQVRLPLQPGDCLVLVSDGVTDKLGSLEDAGFLTTGPAAEVLAALVARLEPPLDDDATLAVLRIAP